MKNFSLGLVVGVLLTSLLSIVTQKSEVGKHNSNVEINIKKGVKALDFQANSNSGHSAKSRLPHSEGLAKNELISDDKLDEPIKKQSLVDLGSNRENIIKILSEFNQNDLARIQYILENLNNSPIEEVFESEPIDSVWSLKKQSELEYTFYEKSALKDLGTLDSIECKSQTCLASIQVPTDLELRPSYYMDWSTPAAVSIQPNEDDSSLRTIRIYISREK